MLTSAPRFSFGWIIGSLCGLSLSVGACRWLAVLPREGSFIGRSGYACAFFCALGVGVVCWATILAFFGRILRWSPRTCRLVGISFFLPFGLVFIGLGHTRPVSVFINLTTVSVLFTGFVCQRLVYPHATSDELNTLEPPVTLFPK